MKKGVILLMSVVFSLVNICLAEEKKAKKVPTYKLGEVVVTATRTERAIGEIPASVSVVTTEDIENSTAHFADELLKSIPGAYLKRSKFMDAVSSVTLRGFPGRSRTLVMLDGQPLNDAYTSGVQWPSIPIDNIERIEVVKGPFSSLYGGNAMGGVINIITKTPKKREIELKSGYGTYHTFCSHLHYADKFFKNLGIYLSIDNKSTNGYRSNLVVKPAYSGVGTIPVTGWERTKSPTGKTRYLIGDKGENYWDQWQYAGKIVWDISPNSKLSFNANISKYKFGYSDPQSYLRDANGNEVTEGSVTFDDNGNKKMTIYPYQFLQGESEDSRNTYMLKYLTLLGDVGLKARLGMNDDSTWYIRTSKGATETGGPGKINETDPKRSIQFEMQVDFPIMDKHTLTFGLCHRYDKAKGKEWNLTDWKDKDSKTTLNTSMEGKQRTESVFAQLELNLNQKIKAFLGGRFDYWKNFDGESYSSKSGTSTYDDTTDSYFSPKLGLVYKPQISGSKQLWKLDTIRVSAGKAFRPPTLYELYKTWEWYSITYESNPNLSPETTFSWEIGIDQSFLQDKTKISATYFESYIEDLIYTKKISSTLRRKENAGKGEIKGVELEVKQYITPWLDAFANFTYQDTEITKNEADPDSIGKQFTHVPEKMYNLGLSLHCARLEGSITWRWVDKVFGYSDNSDTERRVFGAYDPVKLLDAKLAFNVNKDFKISLSANNILDKEYYQYYKAPGRTFFGEVAIKF